MWPSRPPPTDGRKKFFETTKLMASSLPSRPLALLLSLLFLAAPSLLGLAHGDDITLTYHGGPLLTGDLDISILYYGRIGRIQKNAIRSFLKSLNSVSPHGSGLQPTVSSWWNVVESYQSFVGRRENGRRINVRVTNVVTDTSYSVGKIMTLDLIKILVQKTSATRPNTLAVIVMDRQVTVQEMCTGKCVQHGAFGGQAYVLVGNPETECPGACAWPFHRAAEGPQGVVLQPPSGSVGADAMIVLLASGLADAVTNPFNSGFFTTGNERHNVGTVGAGTACRGMFGSGAFPGFTGKIRVDPKTGGAFNTHGIKGHQFLLPALWNPATSSCWTPF